METNPTHRYWCHMLTCLKLFSWGGLPPVGYTFPIVNVQQSNASKARRSLMKVKGWQDGCLSYCKNPVPATGFSTINASLSTHPPKIVDYDHLKALRLMFKTLTPKNGDSLQTLSYVSLLEDPNRVSHYSFLPSILRPSHLSQSMVTSWNGRQCLRILPGAMIVGRNYHFKIISSLCIGGGDCHPHLKMLIKPFITLARQQISTKMFQKATTKASPS